MEKIFKFIIWFLCHISQILGAKVRRTFFAITKSSRFEFHKVRKAGSSSSLPLEPVVGSAGLIYGVECIQASPLGRGASRATVMGSQRTQHS